MAKILMKDNNIHIIRKEKCSIGDIILRSDKILILKPDEDRTTATIEELKEQYEIFMDITNGIPHLFYSDNSNMKSFGTEERVFVSNNFHHFASACAIKENSAITRYITHSFLYLNKSKVPIKMFKTEETAISWLKSLN
jgi:hypothetical protein